MKFIFFGNSDYTTEKFDNTDNFVKLIEKINDNIDQLADSDFIIYGGNFYPNNTDTNEENKNKSCVDIFTKKIRTFKKDLDKKIMFGSWDLFDSLNQNPNLELSKSNIPKLLNFYNSNPDFEVINGIYWKIIPKNQTILIMFDSNLFQYPNPKDILVSTTPFKYIFKEFMEKNDSENNKTIFDLIEYQFKEIYKLLNKQKNSIQNIIFISQYPIAYQNTSNLSLISNKHFVNWLCENSLELIKYKIYYLSRGIEGFSSSNIYLSKQSGSEKINLLNLTQYIVGTGENNLAYSTESENLTESKNYTSVDENIEINSKFTGEPYQINLKFTPIEEKKIFWVFSL